MTSDGFECGVINGVVMVRFQGAISAEAADHALPAVMKVGMESNCHRFLYDIRLASLTESAAKMYARPAQIEGLGMKHGARHGMLCAKVTENARFLKNVTVNRGFQFRVFTDEAEC